MTYLCFDICRFLDLEILVLSVLFPFVFKLGLTDFRILDLLPPKINYLLCNTYI